MLSEQERNYGLGMDALVTVCSWNTRTLLWFWHGYSGHRMLLEHERNFALCLDERYLALAKGSLNRGRSHGPFASPGNEAKQRMLLTTENFWAYSQSAA